MDASSISDLCISACGIYYEHLKENERAIIYINIRSLKPLDEEKLLWALHVNSKIYDVDHIQIIHNTSGTIFKVGEFNVVEYDVDSGVLIIKFEFPNDVFQNNIDPRKIQLFSSLLFLVKNIQEWFYNNGKNIKLPQLVERSAKNQAKLHDFDKNDSFQEAFDDQKEAIFTALRENISYIWGPPGTGKTWIVLTKCVLFLAKDPNNKIGIFAPTNIALEQAMDAVITNAELIGLEKDIFFRIGTPSRKFSTKYPAICETAGIEKKISEANNQIKLLSDIIKFRLGKRTLNSVNFLIYTLERLEIKFNCRDNILGKLARLREERNIAERHLNKISTKIRKIFVGDSVESDLKKTIDKQSRVKQELDEIDTEINALVENILQVEIDSDKLSKIVSDFDITNRNEMRDKLLIKKREIEDWLVEREALSSAYSGKSDSEIEIILRSWESNLEKLEISGVKERLCKSRVVGMTLDTYVGRFRDTPPSFNHIFLDEAGYTPVIKAITLFRHNAQITMLGDHNQLPPIVEMDEEKIQSEENHPVALFGSPAIHVGRVFNELNHYDLIEKLINNDDTAISDLPIIKCKILKFSSRFSSNLCSILDDLFYNFGFTGIDTHPLSIFYIDISEKYEPDGINRRESPAEVDAIIELLERFNFDDLAILTPYKNQESLLGQKLPELQMEERILTIHKSQGREWDSILLSIVDGGRWRPWFTDTNSNISNGRKVMNTAVSRARKKLILVCDVNHWVSRKDKNTQLVSRLIEIGKPFPLS